MKHCLFLLTVCCLGLGGILSVPAQTGPTGDTPKTGLLERLRERRAETASLAALKRMTWTVNGVPREALVYIPPGADAQAPLPVVFAFHGHGGRDDYAARKLAIHQFWPQAICVYPQGLPTAVPKLDPEGKKPGWQKYIGDQNDRDLTFFDAMLATLKAGYRIDEHRIYSTGHSNGGFFTYVLWCARGDLLAAVAPVAATLDPRDLGRMRPKPVLHVAGEKDPIVPYALQQRTMEEDRRLNGCDPAGKPAGAFCTEYSSKNGPPVVTFIHPGGHGIPDGAVERIAAFFQAHPKP